MIRGQGTEDRGQMVECRYAARATRLRGKAATRPLSSVFYHPSSGFTLVEMIMVIVITGIIGGIVAVFIQMPVQGYIDTARRADMTDIADTALRRMSRDIRTALPNSVSVTTSGGARGAGGCMGDNSCFIEFLPTKGSGRYRAGVANPATDNPLNFTVADNCFDVLGPMPTYVAGDSVVVYNRGITGVADAYDGTSRSAYRTPTACTPETPSTAATIGITAKQFPFQSPGNRFQVISTPVTYVCDPVGGTLTRYWGYTINATQPNAVPITGASSALLANKVSACSFSYEGVGKSLALVTMNLGITDSGETVTLYSATHVSNVP